MRLKSSCLPPAPLAAVMVIMATLSVCDSESGSCPSPEDNPSCPCFNFEDGLFLECPGASPSLLHQILTRIKSPVKSLSVHDFDKSVRTLSSRVFPPGVVIRQLQLSQSNLESVEDDVFSSMRSTLESLSVVGGKLKRVPQKALNGLEVLRALDLEGNHIADIPSYSFYGLKLSKLNMKANSLDTTSEYAFAGLEKTLTELDLTENKLRAFPITSLRLLDHLVSVRLSWNEISDIRDDGFSRLSSLLFLDLSSNNFEVIPANCFRPTPSLTTLSLHYNSIEAVHEDAFVALLALESLDVSHNKIVLLDPQVFRYNKKLRTIDLSNNHIHYISGVFEKLPELREIFLSENNILEVPRDAFTGSYSISVIYLQQNAVRRIDSQALASLLNLSQLYLSGNFIKYLPSQMFSTNHKLTSLSLDNNHITHLEPKIFEQMTSLREVRLQDNRLDRIQRGVFDSLPSLLELHLQNNVIKKIESGSFRSLQSLQHINLQGNLIPALGDVFLHESASLVSIQLDSNRIDSLHNESLKGQASVQIMWLGHNRLTRLDRSLFKDLLFIQRIYFTNNSISTIEDRAFEPMQALTFLDLSFNQLKQINRNTFSELNELEELFLNDNLISTITPYSLMSLKKLRILDLSNNLLKTLHDKIFQGGLPIRNLNLKHCLLERIESNVFSGLTNLYELNLEWNHLPPDALRRLSIPGLRQLKAGGNNFSSLLATSLTGLESMEALSLDNSSISHLPDGYFSSNKYLAAVSLSFNSLTNLSAFIFTDLSNLKDIKLTGNLFSQVPYQALSNVSILSTLSMASNALNCIDFSKLTGMPNIRELDFRDNKISSLTGFASSNLAQLQIVYLNKNFLSALPVNFFVLSTQLVKLDLSENRFWQIPPVVETTLTSLSWLNVTGNPMTRLHDAGATRRYNSLEEIHICNTNLTIVTSKDFEAFPALVHLFLSHNRLTRVSPGAFRSLSKLLALDLSVNELELLPQERLQGLFELRVLNVTHNRLKELEEFPQDLKQVQILDLSFNQFAQIAKHTFRYLDNLAELHLTGNWITSVSSDAFKPLKKLRILDLSRNYLENLPLNAFRPLETQIRSLRTEENPITCTCEQQELWEWLRDHQKLVAVTTGGLRCEHPPELRGLLFLELDPPRFCSTPLVLKLAIQDIQPFSVVVSWQSRNHTGLHGYNVAYRSLDKYDEPAQMQLLDRGARSIKVGRLEPDTRYLVCVVGLGTWVSSEEEGITEEGVANTLILQDSPTSKCTEARTLDAPEMSFGKGSGDKWDSSNSILTRRLGLIVGSCTGTIVFFILVSILGYLKIKKQRQVLKRDQPLPPEYISYRHFSIQSGDGVHPTGHAVTTSITYS